MYIVRCTIFIWCHSTICTGTVFECLGRWNIKEYGYTKTFNIYCFWCIIIIALVNVVSERMYSGDSAAQSIYHIQQTTFIHPICGLKINKIIISVASSLIYSELWWSVYVINYDLLNNDEQRIIRNFIITIRNANLFLTIQEFFTNCNPWKLHTCPHHSTALGIKSSSDHWQWIWICKIDTIKHHHEIR